MKNNTTPAHVVVFPLPLTGHINPFTKLAQLLCDAGLHVSLLVTAAARRNFFAHIPVDPNPRFRILSVPDGLPEDASPPFFRLITLSYLTDKAKKTYTEILSASNESSWPHVSCVIADGLLKFAFDVPYEMGIPTMIMRTSSAASVFTYYSGAELVESGELAYAADDVDMDAAIQGVAGTDCLRRRDLPGFVRKAKPGDPNVQYFKLCSANLTKAKALILNTFESLDLPVISQLRNQLCPVVYSVGPLHVLSKNASTPGLISAPQNVWNEDRTCMTWLDRQPRESVVYVSFGSIAVISRDELLEFWHGLVNSGKRFLWVVRPDLVQTAVDTVLEELEQGTRERGCLVQWAPQEEVLAHASVGCFLTHSGWNSTLESIVAGVPMICWPFLGDQYTNSRFVSEVWKIGLDMKDTGGRDVVERMVREAMDGDQAHEMRSSARKLAKEAKDSVEEGGFSYREYQKLIQHIKSFTTTATVQPSQ